MVNKLLISVFLLYDGFMIAQNQPTIGFPSNHFTQFTTADGLPGNVIDAFDIDQQGFMWLATNNGLGRYDGQRFTPFKDLVAQSTLPNKAIRYVFADSRGHLWLRFLFDGAYRIDLNTYKVTHLTDSFWTIDANYLPSCLEDKAGNVWLSVRAGLVKYTHKTNAFTFYPNQDSTTRSIISLCEGDDNYCWVVSRGGLFRFDFQSHRFERENALMEHEKSIRAAARDAEGKLWFSRWYNNDEGLVQYDPKERKIVQSFGKTKNPELAITGTDAHNI